jgi:hypothetical protein
MDELEDRLKRYRPVGPPADLRARVVAAASTRAPGPWAWVPSAAAAAAAFLLYVLAASARRDLSAELVKTEPHRDAIVQALAADLGGDVEASEVAARLIEMDDANAAAGTDSGMPLELESDRHD